MKSIVVSDSTYELIMTVYRLFRDVFDSLDDFLKACVQQFYWENTGFDSEKEEEYYDEKVFELVWSRK